MPGQPNRKKPEELERARPVGHGVPGGHEIDAFWADTDDPKVLKDRLRRYKAQVEKVKRDRSELKVALKLKTEEAFVDGQLSIAPLVVETRKRLAETVARLAAKDVLDDDELKMMKVGLQQLDRWEDRTYGKTRQRVQTTSFSASADITEIMNRKHGVLSEASEDAPIDGEFLDEETEPIDE